MIIIFDTVFPLYTLYQNKFLLLKFNKTKYNKIPTKHGDITFTLLEYSLPLFYQRTCCLSSMRTMPGFVIWVLHTLNSIKSWLSFSYRYTQKLLLALYQEYPNIYTTILI